jgi:hypothetical protein
MLGVFFFLSVLFVGILALLLMIALLRRLFPCSSESPVLHAAALTTPHCDVVGHSQLQCQCCGVTWTLGGKLTSVASGNEDDYLEVWERDKEQP